MFNHGAKISGLTLIKAKEVLKTKVKPLYRMILNLLYMESSVNERIKSMVSELGYKSKRAFAHKIGLSQTSFNDVVNGAEPKYSTLYKIMKAEPSINPGWLLTGQGEMLKSEKDDKDAPTRHLVPFYDDIVSIGGLNDVVANTDGTSPVSEWIDTGDWFTEATAAIRHYGDSMKEYPSGCILALREIQDRDSIVWGKNYVIETDEYRLTKRLHIRDDGMIVAYSTNEAKYADGQLIHQPVPIPGGSIRRLLLVLGCVVKEQSSGVVYTRKKQH
jgi:phage repressor protein C with HTH and peptisase S24 domain